MSAPPPRRETSKRSVVVTGLLIIVVLMAIAFAGVSLLGGGSKPSGVAAPTVSPAGTAQSGGGSKKGAKPVASPSRPQTAVAVFNGTPSEGLAANLRDRLLTSGYADANVSADNDPQGAKTRATSLVLYRRGSAAAGKDVARVLDIQQVKLVDATTQALAPDKSVIVEVGADKSGN
jgi:hypothetical protein